MSHWNNGAKYQISLKNLADYAVFSNWKVTFRLGSQTVTIDQNNHTAEINGDDLKELIVTAAAGTEFFKMNREHLSKRFTTDWSHIIRVKI